MNKVYRSMKSKRALTEDELKQEAGFWFTMDRLEGEHCDCEGEGEFYLYPKDHEMVVEGGKRYMRCMACGCHSHL